MKDEGLLKRLVVEDQSASFTFGSMKLNASGGFTRQTAEGRSPKPKEEPNVVEVFFVLCLIGLYVGEEFRNSAESVEERKS